MYGPVSDDESVKLLNHAIDIGCTFWDTADVYGGGHNELLLSKVLKTRRKEVFLATKFGVIFEKAGSDFDGDVDKLIRGVSGEPEFVRKEFADSLQRLGTDYVDLYYMHRMDPKVPIETTVAAMAELVKEGKVRFLGLSECSAEDLRRAYKVHPIAAVEIEYSPWSTQSETDGLIDACNELGVTIVAYAPLGRGFMSGQIRSFDDLNETDWRRNNPRFQPECFANNLKLVDAFADKAKQLNHHPTEVALAWLLAQHKNLAVIPGTRKIKYLDQNFAAGQIVLPEQVVRELRDEVDNVVVQGARYRPH
ncbi:hypothetical protein LPJ53_006490 [Coemansia erecta]|uniref:NADP-dependent oxidoreductase domain-containing protein n=1 Tax=Coemansia erecta TaxID=147472 RepID=A0A9W7XT32_9FUNG|nr:hypothetical protein LPJ53_006490 [Coemansia erecta]